MFMILLVLLVVMTALVIALTHQLKKTLRDFKQSEKDLRNSRAAYLALEEGADEQNENYEQQFLSHQETIDAAWKLVKSQGEDITRLLRIVDHHNDTCLPDYTFELSDEDKAMLGYLHR